MSVKVTTIRQLDKTLEAIARGEYLDDVTIFFEDTPHWEKKLLVIPNYLDNGETVLLDEKNKIHWVISEPTSLSTAEDIFSYYY